MRRAVVAVITTLLLLLASIGSAAAANCVAAEIKTVAPGGGISEFAQMDGVGEEIGAGSDRRGTGLAPTCAREAP